MISRLTLKNFTVFKEADFEFAPGLNVLVGENGTGKSHVLKAAYAALAVLSRGANRTGPATPAGTQLEQELFKKLSGLFQGNQPGNLLRGPKTNKHFWIKAWFGSDESWLAFQVAGIGLTRVSHHPAAWLGARPAFLPTRELLTIFPGFVSLYDTREVAFDETWRDTCNLLGLSRLKGEGLEQVRPLWEAVEQSLGGSIQLVKDRFEMTTRTGTVPAPFMAEGQAKLGMVAHLIANGSIAAGSTLFWDEPEANLNPRFIKQVARTILGLCRIGVQVILSTHSLFLLRELEILHKHEDFQRLTTHFIGLHPTPRGVQVKGIEVEQGETAYDMGHIVSLDEELSQSDRFLASERR